MRVNGHDYPDPTSSRLLLSDYLRHGIGLTGTHVGCEHGVCGCCTVLIDARTARSCLTLAVQAIGHEVTTVEGLAAANAQLHRVQQAFLEHHGLQCGFCTPGFVISLVGCMNENPDPSADDLEEAISGNLCRCTGYAGIRRAARSLAIRP